MGSQSPGLDPASVPFLPASLLRRVDLICCSQGCIALCAQSKPIGVLTSQWWVPGLHPEWSRRSTRPSLSEILPPNQRTPLESRDLPLPTRGTCITHAGLPVFSDFVPFSCFPFLPLSLLSKPVIKYIPVSRSSSEMTHLYLPVYLWAQVLLPSLWGCSCKWMDDLMN